MVNFNNIELNQVKEINGKQLIITAVSQKQSGGCTHNLYSGTLDGESFIRLNSPKLKRLIGIKTMSDDRTSTKALTTEKIEEIVNKFIEREKNKMNKFVENYQEIKDALSEQILHYISMKAIEITSELTQKMQEQQEELTRRNQKSEAQILKERCANVGLSVKQATKMSEAKGISLDELLTKMESVFA